MKNEIVLRGTLFLFIKCRVLLFDHTLTNCKAFFRDLALIDHERHVQDFTDRAKAIVTKEHLDRVCSIYQLEKGIWLNREPVAVFWRPGNSLEAICFKGKG